jgi:hypothetical protein
MEVVYREESYRIMGACFEIKAVKELARNITPRSIIT